MNEVYVIELIKDTDDEIKNIVIKGEKTGNIVDEDYVEIRLDESFADNLVDDYYIDDVFTSEEEAIKECNKRNLGENC